jgi:hypothetical protein
MSKHHDGHACLRPSGFLPWQSGGNVRAGDGRAAIKRILFITLLTILGGLVLAVSLTLTGYVLLSFYAADR